MSMPTLAPARRAIGTTIMAHGLAVPPPKRPGASAKDLPGASHQQQRVGEGALSRGAGSLVVREAGGQSRASVQALSSAVRSTSRR